MFFRTYPAALNAAIEFAALLQHEVGLAATEHPIDGQGFSVFQLPNVAAAPHPRRYQVIAPPPRYAQRYGKETP